jgi:hypothetical protein
MAMTIFRRRNAPSRLRRLLGRLRRDQRGISVVEFAISLPIFSALAMYGLEIAYMATVNMQVSQLALAVADNASRLGQTDNSAITPTVAESDIDAVMFGALEQGKALDFQENGRVILSSLERDSATGRQFIHWQRCAGALERHSSYGDQTSDHNGLTGPELDGMGRPENKVHARNKEAVMFAEVYYTYQPLFGSLFVDDLTFKQEAAFVIRDDRNLGSSNARGTTGTINAAC